MKPEYVLIAILGLPAILLWATIHVEKALKDNSNYLRWWHAFHRWSWGLSIWLWFTIISSSVLQRFYPEQSTYLLSGSDITLGPAIVWGVIVGWVCLGGSTETEGDGRYSSYDQRIDAIFSGGWKVLKYAGIVFLIGIVILIVYFIGQQVQERVDTMSNGEAIVLGSIIIALAVFYGMQRRGQGR